MGKRRRKKKSKNPIIYIFMLPLLPFIVMYWCIKLIIWIINLILEAKGTPIIFKDLKDGYQFEIYISNLLKRNGFYNVRITPKSGDYGVDVIAYQNGYKYAIQCKLYSRPVGVKAVQEVHAGKTFHNCNIAVVVTNNTFTANAKALASVNGVELWDCTKIRTMERA